jgi:hypothetical protein
MNDDFFRWTVLLLLMGCVLQLDAIRRAAILHYDKLFNIHALLDMVINKQR